MEATVTINGKTARVSLADDFENNVGADDRLTLHLLLSRLSVDAQRLL